MTQFFTQMLSEKVKGQSPWRRNSITSAESADLQFGNVPLVSEFGTVDA